MTVIAIGVRYEEQENVEVKAKALVHQGRGDRYHGDDISRGISIFLSKVLRIQLICKSFLP